MKEINIPRSSGKISSGCVSKNYDDFIIFSNDDINFSVQFCDTILLEKRIRKVSNIAKYLFKSIHIK